MIPVTRVNKANLQKHLADCKMLFKLEKMWMKCADLFKMFIILDNTAAFTSHDWGIVSHSTC